MERLVRRIDTITPTDTPARKAWERAQRLSIPESGTLDLDKLNILMYAGLGDTYGPHDGMHRLARVLDVRGYCLVSFSIRRGHERHISDLMMLTRHDGVFTLQVFLEMCKAGRFLRGDTA